MILMRLKGGLGNQMFQYALGRRLAFHHHVPLLLDLSWFETQSLRQYRLDRFSIAAQVASPQQVSQLLFWGGRRLPGRLFRFLQPRLPLPLRRCLYEQVHGFDPRILRLSPPVYLDGYWQSERYFQDIAPLIRAEFTLRQPLSPPAQELVRAIQSGPSVSLHVRRGDYASNPHTRQVHGLLPSDYYQRAAQLIQGRFPHAVFYVFSDDHEWASHNLSFLEPAVYVCLASPDRDVEELVLISRCQHHVVANSSYSWWGAWLGEAPAKLVVAPQNWFASPSRPVQGLLPENWIRL